MLGAVFFVLIQHSIDYGYKSGYFIAAGVLLSDMIYILMSVFGTKSLPSIPYIDLIITILGFTLLLILGIVNIVKGKVSIFYPKTQSGSNAYYFSKGFLLNALNPVNFFFWVGVTTTMRNSHYSENQLYVFLISCQVAIFFCQVGVAYGAQRIKKFIKEDKILLINKIIGVMFIFFAFKLLYSYYY